MFRRIVCSVIALTVSSSVAFAVPVQSRNVATVSEKVADVDTATKLSSKGVK